MVLATNMFSQKIVNRSISSSFKEDRNFRVWLPEDYDDEQKYGVIYVLDADYLFDIVVANVSFFCEFEFIPPVIIVAVDYKNGREDIGFNFSDLGLDDTGVDFKNYINNELIPFIDSVYSTNHLNTIIGHSYTATYLLNYIINRNANFQQYILFAPEKPDVNATGLTFDKSYISNRKFIFVTANDDLERRNNLVDTLYALIMKQSDSAAYLRKVMVEAQHMNMIPFAVPVAIKILYDSYLGGDNLYSFIAHSSLDAESLWTTVKNNNQKLYNISVHKNAGNALYLLRKASQEKNYKLINAIVEELTADKGANLLEILGNFLEQTDKEKAEQYYIKSIKLYSEENHDEWSLNVRRRYASRILAPMANLSGAWEILNYPDNYILKYEKGLISAKYNYGNEEGIRLLEICLKNQKELGDWGVKAQNILFLIAQCYKNMKNKKSAIDYINKALKIEPENEEYLLFKKNINGGDRKSGKE
jgi:predicted alpha/beta superfamily hydrolase